MVAHRISPRGRLAVLVALAAVPWTVILAGGRPTLVFPFGLLDAGSMRLVLLHDLFARGGGLPRTPGLLPASVLLYLGALASATAGLAGREDRRVTGGLLVLAGLAHLGVAFSLRHRPRYVAVPAGPVLLLAAAWWLYGRDLRATFAGPDG